MELAKDKEKMYFSSLITFSVLRKRVLRFLHFLGVCLLRWVTSQLWQQRWVRCKNVLLQQKEVLLHLYRRFTYLRMTLRIQRRQLPLPTWMLQPYFHVKLLSLVFIQRWILWILPLEFLLNLSLEKSTTLAHKE